MIDMGLNHIYQEVHKYPYVTLLGIGACWDCQVYNPFMFDDRHGIQAYISGSWQVSLCDTFGYWSMLGLSSVYWSSLMALENNPLHK